MKIKLVFTKSRKKLPIGGWLIMLWTWKNYSHVARVGKISFAEKEHYYQANEGKVNYEYDTFFKKKNKIVKEYILDIPKELHRYLVKTSWEQCGAKYGILQNLGIVWVDIGRLFGKKWQNPWKTGYNCSELIYRTVILPLWGDQGYDPDTIKPHHIEKILLNKGYSSS